MGMGVPLYGQLEKNAESENRIEAGIAAHRQQ